MISTNAIAVSGPTPGWVACRCASGHFSTTWSTARFNYAMVGFNRSDEAACFELLCKRAGTQVHYCAEPFSNDGRLSSTFLKLVKRTMAAEYQRELSAKVHAGQCRIAERGFKVGGRAGYGLRRLLLDSSHRPKAILRDGERKSLTTIGPRSASASGYSWVYLTVTLSDLVKRKT